MSLDLASSEVTRIAARSASLELATGAPEATGGTEVVARPAARNPYPTRAGGKDDGSYTNSLKSYHIISYHIQSLYYFILNDMI